MLFIIDKNNDTNCFDEIDYYNLDLLIFYFLLLSNLVYVDHTYFSFILLIKILFYIYYFLKMYFIVFFYILILSR
jgi:hypothetical protein